MITFKHSGDFEKTTKYFNSISKKEYLNRLDYYGQLGVLKLAEATPKDTGKTAASWDYKITNNKASTTITWYNSNIVDGVPVAILIQYGHGTRSGAYVSGIDFINPAMKPIFDELSELIRREVSE